MGSVWIPGGGGGGNLGPFQFRRNAMWHASGILDRGAAAVVLAADTLYAVNFYEAVADTAIFIAIEVTALSAGSARLGIYADNGDTYPGALVLDAGEVDTGTTGAKAIAITEALDADTLYWLVILASATPTIYGQATISSLGLIGATGLGTTQMAHWDVAQAYGALPANFPGGGTPRDTSPKRVMLKF